jgi:hypothetical protein
MTQETQPDITDAAYDLDQLRRTGLTGNCQPGPLGSRLW